MAKNGKDPVLVILQMSGGNDFMHTLIPYTSSTYYDNRKLVRIEQEDVLQINDELGFNPNFAPMKEMYDEGMVGIVQGIGYPNSNRSHFRGMDIWHTCEPDKVVTEGWLGKALKELDPNGEDELTGINFGIGLPRAMAVPGVPVTSVNDLDTYGLLTGISEQDQRDQALQIFKEMYGPAIGTGPVMEYLSRTGIDVLRGADRLKAAPAQYSSDVEYADNGIAKSLRDIAKVHTAGLGTRIFYTSHGGYDTHANENPAHPKLLQDISGAIRDFFDDLKAHDAADNVVMLVFTEFGRRIRDNGSGTDHGSGGGAYIIGEPVAGGLYSEYPSLKSEDWAKGEDLEHTIDFRGIYGTMLEQWMGIEASPIVGGNYEQIKPFK
ncbi:MAG: DUF1501 domain-containing protein [Chloroflexi bacterium]|nr:DUF1501 domain-containing protein [Chloroflexota bacterium]MCI0796130.1 DUF1501 domain-containing protein [Chloroflexota bacterium]MCI0812605.1 DUF1501 domain-containing protein [Chloroflexota bacterium]MCI0822508.1 DUF1501 domain-containing protein [Chloroflexota bacterium]MCI0840986.1 DUF1501 domain-containing protein [Chloroflexota bacterium]